MQAPLEEQPLVSVVLATYNRRPRLERALKSLLACELREGTAEILVVDNNSTDDTREFVCAMCAAGNARLRYFCEPRQGVAYARNTGILAARADLIAFTDDDEQVAPDWLQVIVDTFREHPHLDFIAGKVLPRWPHPPPAWLDLPLWGAVGLVNPGDMPLDLDADHPRNVRAVGAGNLAARRLVIARNLFEPRFQRVRDSTGSSEDWELLTRICRAGARGRYVPHLVAYSDVEPVRLTKRYHRRWQYRHGGYRAMMGIERPSGGLLMLGVPGWYYRESADYVRKWARSAWRGETGPGAAFEHQLHAVRAAGYIRKSWTMQPRGTMAKDMVRVGRELVRRAVVMVRARAGRSGRKA